ncbi:hypothetical protein E4U41_003830 [Claviceps citrina]|nr:hypothetical protein E4U41_003830 [Claviceps citrina]
MLVTLAFSNSSLKTYEYDCRAASFELLAVGTYTGACLTQVRHLGSAGYGSGSGSELHAMTASTDGHLALWVASLDGLDAAVGVPSYVLRAAAAVHQSSIKSLDMAMEGTQCRVVTGGDDNAVGFVQIAEVTGTGTGTTYDFVSRSVLRKAHAAAVNGVALLPTGRRHDLGPGEMLCVSVSNDQRIKVWRISMDHDAPQLRVSLVACVSSGVADPGDVAVVCPGLGRPSRIVVGGVGLEVWEMP